MRRLPPIAYAGAAVAVAAVALGAWLLTRSPADAPRDIELAPLGETTASASASDDTAALGGIELRAGDSGSVGGDPDADPSPGGGSGSENTPAPSGTEAAARAAAATFLDALVAGDAAAARAAATPAFAAAMGDAFFAQKAGAVTGYEILLVAPEKGRWNVYVGETWSVGGAESRYGLASVSGRLLVDSVEYNDALP